MTDAKVVAARANGAKGGRPRHDGPRDVRGALLKGGEVTAARRLVREANKAKKVNEDEKKAETAALRIEQQSIYNALPIDIRGRLAIKEGFEELEKGALDKAHIIFQPHRQYAGEDLTKQFDRMAESALGRFVMNHDLETDVYEGGLALKDLHDRWLSAWSGPRGAGTPGDRPTGTGDGPSTEEAGEWSKQLKEINSAIEATGTWPAKWVSILVLEERDLDLKGYEIEAVKTGLVAMTEAVAQAFGK